MYLVYETTPTNSQYIDAKEPIREKNCFSWALSAPEKEPVRKKQDRERRNFKYRPILDYLRCK